MIADGFFHPSLLRRTLILIALCLGTMFLVLADPHRHAVASLKTAPSESNVIDFIELDGVIDPVSSRYLLRQIESAENGGSHAVVVRLDTPGGLDVSMRDMVKKMLSAEVPVVVWVAPKGARAASAGVFLAYAANVAVMAPGTNIGAAHPVNLGGEMDEESSRKATNDAAAYIRSIAKERGRNPDWAEDAVRESVSVDALEAEKLGVIDFVAGSPKTLYDRLDGRSVRVEGGEVELATAQAEIRFHKMGLLERILHTAVRPEVAYLLLLIGMYGLIFELYHPGVGLAGILGGVSLILGFYALSVLPTSWAGVALILIGVIFFLVDLHTAGLGVWTVGGTVALIAGSLVLFSGVDPELRLAWWAIAGATLASLLFFIGAMTAAIRARLSKPVSGSEGLIGVVGTARGDIAPEGQVSARGTIWKARTAGAAIPQGAQVKVKSVSGMVLIVEPVKVEAAAE